MENYRENSLSYLQAQKKVKKLKGFYIHATVYVLVNLFVIAGNIQLGESLSNMDNYWAAIFWGIGLLVHGITVFMPKVFFGSDWEERKTRELMDKYK